MAPENIAWGVLPAMLNLLQWGRGRMAPENEIRQRSEKVSGQLQWGRGRMAPENSSWSAVCLGRRSGFNGAGAEWPRKTPRAWSA